MRGVIVADNVNLLILGRRLIDLAQKRQPFLMAMPLGAGAQHLPCQGVQCRKQGSWYHDAYNHASWSPLCLFSSVSPAAFYPALVSGSFHHN